MNNSAAGQRQAILTWLQQQGTLTTIQARDELGIMSPAARVMELREQGHQIVTYRTVTIDRTGTKHREAKYILFNQDNKKALTASVETNGKGFAHNTTDNNSAGGIRQFLPLN